MRKGSMRIFFFFYYTVDPLYFYFFILYSWHESHRAKGWGGRIHILRPKMARPSDKKTAF